MQNENDLEIEVGITKGNDSVQVRRTLNRLQEPPARNLNVPKIIQLSPGQTKIVCKNHKFATVIDLHDAPFRVSRGSNMQEFECDCGIIFQKG